MLECLFVEEAHSDCDTVYRGVAGVSPSLPSDYRQAVHAHLMDDSNKLASFRST